MPYKLLSYIPWAVLEDPLPLPLTLISELQTVSRGSGSIEHPLPEVLQLKTRDVRQQNNMSSEIVSGWCKI